MINAFSSRPNLKTKSSLEDSALRLYYKIMNAFILKVLIVTKSQRLCHVQFSLYRLTPGVLIYYLKSKHQKQGDEFEKHPFCTNMSLWVGIHGKSVAWGQVNRQRLEETMYILPCHSCYICGSWRSKEVGVF